MKKLSAFIMAAALTGVFELAAAKSENHTVNHKAVLATGQIIMAQDTIPSKKKKKKDTVYPNPAPTPSPNPPTPNPSPTPAPPTPTQILRQLQAQTRCQTARQARALTRLQTLILLPLQTQPHRQIMGNKFPNSLFLN